MLAPAVVRSDMGLLRNDRSAPSSASDSGSGNRSARALLYCGQGIFKLPEL